MPRPLSARIVGLTRFRHPLEIDLSGIPPGLVALVGENGAGKSTLMDVLSGFVSLFRALSARKGGKTGSLKDYCVRRDTEIELVQAYAGRVYRHLLQVDPDARGGAGVQKAYLFEDGAPVGADGVDGQVSDGGTTVYDDAILRLFPSRDIFLASAFAAQNRAGNFLELSQADRKDLFVKLLGLEHMQERAERAKLALVPLELAAKRFDEEATTIAALRETREQLRTARALHQETVTTRTAELASADTTLHTAASQLAAAVALRDQLVSARASAIDRRDELIETSATADQESAGLDQSITRLAVITNDDTTIRDRAASLVAAINDKREIETAFRAARATHTAKGEAHRTATTALARAEAEEKRLATALVTVRAAEISIPTLEAKLLPLAGYRQEVEQITASIKDLEPAVRIANGDAMRERMAADIFDRDTKSAIKNAEEKAGLLAGVPCEGRRVLVFGSEADEEVGAGRRADCGTCRFLADARGAAESLPGLRAKLAEGDAVRARADEKRTAADAAQAELDRLVAARDQVTRRIALLAPAEIEVARHRATVAAGASTMDALLQVQAGLPELRVAVTTAAAEVQATLIEKDAVEARGHTAAARVSEFAGADDRLRELEAALSQLPLLRQQAEAAKGRASAARAGAARVVVPPEPEAQEADVARLTTARDEAKRRADEARTAMDAARAAVSQLEGRLHQVGDLDARQTALDARRAAVVARRVGFALNEQGWGRNGTQALEVDGAGPTVSGICNELLEAGGGPPFTVSLTTIQEAKGVRKQRESFDFSVFDGRDEGGRTPGLRAFDDLSGGEKVWVDEALKLAIALFNAERHGAPFETIWRDETDKGLDERLAPGYPAMLRHAMTRGKFRNVFFVSHRASVWSQADVILRCEDGRVDVEIQ